MADHVFICYARDDQEFVLKLTANLKERGVPVWLDQWDIPPAADWDQSIDDALYNCAHFLIVLSPTAVDSREVRGELRTAMEENKLVVPVLYRQCRIPRQLRLFQHVDFTSCGPDDSAALTQVLRALNFPEARPSEPQETAPETVIEPKMETTTPDHVPFEPRRTKPLPGKPKSTEQKAPEDRKARSALKIGLLAGLAGLLLIVGWWYISPQRARTLRLAVSSRIDTMETQLSESLEQNVRKAESPEQLEELRRQKDTLSRELEVLEQRAADLEMSAELEQLKSRFDKFRQRLAIQEQRLAEPERPKQLEPPKEVIKVGRLFVRTVPRDARIRILNIEPKFHQEIELEPGDYHVEVSADGYEAEKRWIGLSAGEDKTIHFELVKIEAPSEKEYTNSIGMKFVLIRPGTFMMGGGISAQEVAEKYGDKEEWYENGLPQHQVRISKPFYMQTTEVTQGQWERVMEDDPSRFKDCGYNCPVESVSWKDAQDFTRRLNDKESTDKYRLPTEAEWEYACRAGTTTSFHTGNCISTDQANYDGNYPGTGCPEGKDRQRTVRVGSFQPNAWGLYDMHGNVWEWCKDWYEGYFSSDVTDPQGPPSGKYRVARGGAWMNNAGHLLSAYRGWNEPDFRDDYTGFRVARDF